MNKKIKSIMKKMIIILALIFIVVFVICHVVIWALNNSSSPIAIGAFDLENISVNEDDISMDILVYSSGFRFSELQCEKKGTDVIITFCDSLTAFMSDKQISELPANHVICDIDFDTVDRILVEDYYGQLELWNRQNGIVWNDKAVLNYCILHHGNPKNW